MGIQTSSFIWQFHRDPREKVRKGVWIAAPLGVLCFSQFLEDRPSALLIALTANAIATASIKKYARSDEFRKTYNLNTYKEDIALIEEMQRKQKEAKLLYTGIPEHLIPADMKRFVEKPKTGGGWQDRLTDNMNAILGDQGSEKKSKKVMTDNQKLFYRHSLKHTDSSLPEYQRREMEEFSNYKTKKFLGILPHWKRLWNYSIREKDDRKIFGIIKQKGSSTLEQEHMQELKDSYREREKMDC